MLIISWKTLIYLKYSLDILDIFAFSSASLISFV